MALTLFRGYSESQLVGKKVRVYRNLHQDCWSVQLDGLVVAHADSVELKNITFRVQDGGYQRFLRERKKNVHAFICGELVTLNGPPLFYRGTEVTYNPRISRLFHTVEKLFKNREYFFDEHQMLDMAFCGDKTVWVANYPKDQ